MTLIDRRSKWFQSTLPVGGATVDIQKIIEKLTVSIHAPRGGSDQQAVSGVVRGDVSIHAPRGGSDVPEWCLPYLVRRFNPRSPWGERLAAQSMKRQDGIVSIHAPRGGSDSRQMQRSGGNFKFQSTLPVGGATTGNSTLFITPVVSIHAPRGGSDASLIWFFSCSDSFNPRSPWGERQSLFKVGT